MPLYVKLWQSAYIRQFLITVLNLLTIIGRVVHAHVAVLMIVLSVCPTSYLHEISSRPTATGVA